MLYNFSDFEDDYWASPARLQCFFNFIEGHPSLTCVGKSAKGMKAAVKKAVTAKTTEDQINTISNRLSSQWEHRRGDAMKLFKEKILSIPCDEDFSALEKAFSPKPKKKVSKRKEIVNMVYSLPESDKDLDVIYSFLKDKS